MTCGRCATPIPPDGQEYCWWCLGALCVGCWEAFGHCDHPAADEFRRQTSPRSAAVTMVGA